MSSSKTNTNEQVTSSIDPQLKSEYLSNLDRAKQVGGFMTGVGPYEGERWAPHTWAGNQASYDLNRTVSGLFHTMDIDRPGHYMNYAGDLLSHVSDRPWLEVGAYGFNPMPYQSTAATMSPASANIYEANRDAVRDVGGGSALTGLAHYQDANRSGIRDVGTGSAIPLLPLYNEALKTGTRNVGVGSVLENLSDYENPYITGVIDRGLEDLDRARQIQQVDNASAATKQGAFGGGRHGVVEAETNRGFSDAASRFIADQRSAGFGQAAKLKEGDLARELDAQKANQTVDLSAMGIGASMTQSDLARFLQAQGVNQGADIVAAQLASGMSLADVQRALEAQGMNQGVDLQTIMANLQSRNQGAQFNAGLSQDAAKTNAGFAQQSNLANMASMLDTLRFNSESAQRADVANQQGSMAHAGQQMQVAQMMQSLAQQGFNMPMQAIRQLLGFDQYGRGVEQERLDADRAAFDDYRFQDLPELQTIAAALGISIPNLGMSSTGRSTTTYSPSPMQNLGQIMQLAGMLA